ncbi:MAG: hypothetical protein RLZZ347_66 [Candidatus Parcubacteria bacterium]|jgi:cysteine desulfurase
MSRKAQTTKRIYLDYASTTPVDTRVVRAMKRYQSQDFGNPSSIHAEGVVAKKVLMDARKKVATLFSAHPDEVIFTSGGTEANNLAILGTLYELEKKGVSISKMHAITSVVEHSSILECFKQLQSRGMWVDFALVTEKGIVDLKAFKKLLRPETVLVSVQYVNNEIGTIQPIREIAKLLRHQQKMKGKKILLHTDASQAGQYLDMNTQVLGVDLLTIDAHKMYGPKGVGALFVKRGVALAPLLFGGKQEGGLRSTTENVAGVVGLSEAFALSVALRDAETKRLSALRDYFFKSVQKMVPRICINGDLDLRLPNNINISIPGLDAEYAVLQFDAEGVAVSTKSSCLTNESLSYVVFALGGDKERASTSLRFAFGRDTTKEKIDQVLLILKKILTGQKIIT